jgi:hypothetical protein
MAARSGFGSGIHGGLDGGIHGGWWWWCGPSARQRAWSKEETDWRKAASAGELDVGAHELRLGVGIHEQEKGRDGLETEPTRVCGFGSFRGAKGCHILDEYSPTTV